MKVRNLNSSTATAMEQLFRAELLKALGAGPQTAAKPANPAFTRTARSGITTRRTRNSIMEPAAVGVCRAMWDLYDAQRVQTSEEARYLAQDRGWNCSTAAMEFYKWRKFHA